MFSDWLVNLERELKKKQVKQKVRGEAPRLISSNSWNSASKWLSGKFQPDPSVSVEWFVWLRAKSYITALHSV